MDKLILEIISKMGSDVSIITLIFIILILAARFLFSLGSESIISQFKAEINKKEIGALFAIYLFFVIELLIIFFSDDDLRGTFLATLSKKTDLIILINEIYTIILFVSTITFQIIKNCSRNYLLINKTVNNSLSKHIIFVYIIPLFLIVLLSTFIIMYYAISVKDKVTGIMAFFTYKADFNYLNYLLNVVIIIFLTFISTGYSTAIGMLNLLAKYEFIVKDNINNKSSIYAYLIAENDEEYLIKEDMSSAIYIKKENVLAVKCIRNSKNIFLDNIKSFWDKYWCEKRNKRGHCLNEHTGSGRSRLYWFTHLRGAFK